MNNTSTPSCTACGTSDVQVFVEIQQVPVHCNVLWPTPSEALAAPRGDLTLGYCRKCGHVSNLAFDPMLMEYTQAYENSLHFSPSFQRFAEDLADSLIQRYGLRDKDIVDIGCGKGDFLKLICKRGGNRGKGFDPSYVPTEEDARTSPEVTFIQEFYSEHHQHYKADLVACRHVLEHIQHPRGFVASVRRSIGNRPNTAVYFEVPNVLYTLRDLGIWDIIYEHCSYFCANSMAGVFTSSGFDVTDTTETFGGQYLGLQAMPGDKPTGVVKTTTNDLQAMNKLVEAFSVKYSNKVGEWKETFVRLNRDGRKAVVWGGGSKGVTFLNTFAGLQDIGYMVDINPRKQGMYVAGTGQRIISPEFLREYKPDVVIVMNSLYKEEIRTQIAALGLSPEFLFG
ncbi:MAG: class I SAM-dependent methyltransferase [Bacteroidota bacterium]